MEILWDGEGDRIFVCILQISAPEIIFLEGSLRNLVKMQVLMQLVLV